MLAKGMEIPSAIVCYMRNDAPVKADIRVLLRDKRSLIIGMPQAFTPVCSKEHLPSLIGARTLLKQSGIQQVFVIAPDNPWTMESWKMQFPAAAPFVFLSDGNRNFISACDLEDDCPDWFLGHCSKRFAIQTEGTVVKSLSVEESIFAVQSTHGDSLAAAAGRLWDDGRSNVISI